MKRLLLLLVCFFAITSQTFAAGRAFYDGFESGNANLWASASATDRCTVVTTPTDGVLGPYMGTYMARCNWNGTVSSLATNAFESLVINAGMVSYTNEIFYRAHFRTDANTERTNVSAQKTLRIFNGTVNTTTYRDCFASAYSSAAGLVNQVYPGTDNTLNTYWGAATGDNTTSKTAWHTIEYYFNHATGKIRVWHDHIMVRDATASFDSGRWQPFYLTSNWSDAHDAVNYTYFDDVEVFTDTGTGASTGQMIDATITAGGGSTGSTIPPTINTWYSIPSTHIFPLCPTDVTTFGECKYVTIAWNSAALDQTGSLFYVHGGGHGNYRGNEIYGLNLNTAQLSRFTSPTTPVAAAGTAPYCIGTPCVANSVHTYDGLVWIDSIHKALRIGGSSATTGGFTNSAWLMDPKGATPTDVWHLLTSDCTTSGPGGSGATQIIGVLPASGRDKVWSCTTDDVVAYCFDQLNLYSINPTTNVMRSLTNRNTVRNYYITAAYDSVRKLVVLLGGGDNTFSTFDVSGGPTAQVPGSGDATLVNRPTTGATAISGTSAPGLVYDSNRDRIVAWGTGSALNTIFLADMDKALAGASDTWSTITTTGAPNPAIETQNNGINKHFSYSRALNVYYYVGDVNSNMMSLRLGASNPPPVTTITLHWVDVATDETAYSVERKTGTTGTYAEIATPAANATSYVDSTVTLGVTYCYRVRARNAVGYSGYSNESCQVAGGPPVDTTPPTVSITSPADAATVAATVVVSATAADAVGVVGVQFKVDGLNIGAEDTSSPYSASWSTIALANGNHTLTAVARDAAGNQTISAGITANVQNVVTPPPTVSLAYAFDEGTGTVIHDYSANGLNGTMTSAQWIAGKFGAGLAFNGNIGKVVSGLSANIAVRTVMFWVKRLGPGGANYGRMYDKRSSGAETELFYNDAALGVFHYGRTWSGRVGDWTIPQPTKNVWHHMAVVYDSTSALNVPLIYVDGVAQTVTTLSAPSGTVVTNTDPYVIGNRGSGDRGWSVAMDELRIYNSARTQAQIQAVMNVPVATAP